MRNELVFVLAVLAIGVSLVEAANRRREPYTEGRVEQILPLAETINLLLAGGALYVAVRLLLAAFGYWPADRLLMAAGGLGALLAALVLVAAALRERG